jgi:hypothetical protein
VQHVCSVSLRILFTTNAEFPLSSPAATCVHAVHGVAAQQLHVLANALIAACAVANLDTHTQGCSGSSSKLRLWPTCAASDCSTACSTEGADPQQQQQQQQAGSQGTDNTDTAHSLPLHLSLSQTVPIRYGQAASLKAALEKQLRPCRTFKLQLQGLVCLTNEPKTRSFVCIRVATGLQQVSLQLLGWHWMSVCWKMQRSL